MPGWGKLVAGALIGVAGTVYATNEELRKRLPGAARDLPVTVRRRVESAISAGRAASSERRREILRDLERHGGQHPMRETQPGFIEEVEEAETGSDGPGSNAAAQPAAQPAGRGEQEKQA